ncbi:MAG TPA: LacI family transcriptional regulator [Firmicutes bacterium]|nr:LacI family transcriptional regulator [Bacillota bacterium]
MQPRIRDVAKLAGVSDATVSHVINNTCPVSPETRKRVEAAIKELNYRPNVVARSLRVKNTQTIGLVVPNVMNHFFGAIAVDLEKTVAKEGYSLFVCNTMSNPTHERKLLESLAGRRVDGVVMAPAVDSPDALEPLTRLNIPVVFIDRVISGTDYSHVLTNNAAVAGQVVDHLVEDGYVRIVAVVEDDLGSTIRERLQGFKSAAARYGKVEPKLFSFAKQSEAELVALCKEGPKTAVFPLNYQASIRSLRVFRQAEIRFPDDVGFFMFDESEWNEIVVPAISSVKQSAAEVAKEAARLIIRATSEQVQEKVVVPAKLFVRESCSTACMNRYRQKG